MIQNSRYFFYGSPATYALVGREDQHIWLVTDNLSAAQYLVQAFKSKITLVIYDLTTFDNYTQTLIDNTICFNWQVPINVLNTVGVLDTANNKIDSIVYTGAGLELKNIIEHDILLLSANRCQDLQQQLMCIHNICRDFKPTDYIISTKVKEIIAVNLELVQIELELYKLANEIIIEYSGLASQILTTIDRIYE